MSEFPTTIDLGGIEVTLLDGGSFRLDGASLYGVFPRVYWERQNRPDEDNRVLLGLSPVLVRTGGATILIDPGIGMGWGARAADRYDLRNQHSIAELLESTATTPGEVDAVIATHLHFDHVAAAVRPVEGTPSFTDPASAWSAMSPGGFERAFPSARLIVQRSELEAARHPDMRTVTHVAAAVAGVYERAGALQAVEEEERPFPRIRLVHTGGHTPGHQAVWLEGDEGYFLLPGDLIPTTAHLRGDVLEGLDHEPSVSASAKAALLARAVERRALLLFYHAPRVRCARVTSGAGGSYRLQDMQTIPAPSRSASGQGRIPSKETS